MTDHPPDTRGSPQEPDVPSTPEHRKEELRAQMRARINALSADDRRAWSDAACARIAAHEFVAGAKTVMLYAPTRREVDVGPLASTFTARGVRVCLPKVRWEDRLMTPALVQAWGEGLVMGRFGILEPGPSLPKVGASEIDLVVVPGVAFDASGGRLGQGAGFYDRFLAGPGVRARTVGIAFDFQVVDAVPREDWDVPLDAVVTPTRTITRP